MVMNLNQSYVLILNSPSLFGQLKTQFYELQVQHKHLLQLCFEKIKLAQKLK